ncbi:galacturonosyl transferase [Clostridia bacterium]|nr:galacturonosyl transferase [Clostridia bacterium]
MVILVIINSSSGLYSHRYELIEALILRKHSLCIASPNTGCLNYFNDLGCRYEEVHLDNRGINPISDIILTYNFYRLIRRVKPNLVLTYAIKPNIYAGIVCRLLHKPYIINITGLGSALLSKGFLALLTVALYKISTKRTECIIFQNTANQEYFNRRKMVKNRQKLLSGSGVNLEKFKESEYPMEEDNVIFLYLGRIMKEKGMDELLEVILIIKKIYRDRVIFKIIGQIDEDYSMRLSTMSESGLIEYYEKQFDVIKHYQSAHCVVLPSYHEGMSNVLLEAAAIARPVIASDIPGCKETFTEGVSGISCEPRNTKSLLCAIEQFISLPHYAKREMGLAGRRLVERKFDRVGVVNAYLEEIDNIESN